MPCSAIGCFRVSCAEFFKTLWRFRKTLILILTPIVLAVIPVKYPTTEAYCAYAILIMAVYWVTEVIPLAVTALLPMVLFPTLGVMDSKQTCSNYLKDTNMLFVSGLIVATAVEKWNLHRRIALRVLLLVGTKPAWLMFGFMTTTAFLSMWMSNTATAAMMIPIAHAVIVELIEKKREFDKISKIKASTDRFTRDDKPENDGLQEKEKITTFEEIELEESLSNAQTKQGGVDQANNIEIGDLKDNDAMTKEEKNFAKGITLCIAYSANIGGTGTLTGTPPNLVLSGQLESLYGPEAVIDFGSWFIYAFPVMIVCLLIAWLWLQFLYFDLLGTIVGWFSQCIRGNCGKCCEDSCSCCCRRKGTEKEHDPVSGVIRKQYNCLGPMTWAEKAVLGHFTLLALLWLARDPKFAPGWVTAFIPGYVTDSTAGVFIAVLLFCFPSRPPNFGCLRHKNDDSLPAPKQALLDWHTVNTKLPWDVVILLGGGFALADACKVSGLSVWIGKQLVVLANIPPVAMVFVITTLIAAFTEVTSNTSTASIFLPILGELGVSLGIHPYYFMIPATIACSYAFMLPVATPPNAIVFAYGTITIMDMVTAGLLMNILCILVVNLSINTNGYYQFDLGTLPDWANNTEVITPTSSPVNCSVYLADYLSQLAGVTTETGFFNTTM
ncbi:Na(+)/citrate cotransporter-like [Saccoglossus kowalevskii]|uniref:Solute carrier family 13 member 3-like n=1 Tax=Saccoglossus kowalevskii TaxID=10224 RepID=A0ABM0GMP6_SACKO|nr:PREDICTED: solute carrier family 13 member 3-like [Saccoglossus kowalevskii]